MWGWLGQDSSVFVHDGQNDVVSEGFNRGLDWDLNDFVFVCAELGERVDMVCHEKNVILVCLKVGL